MKRKIAHKAYLWFCWLLCSFVAFGEDYLSKDEALKMAFPDADSFKMHRMIATKAQRAKLSEKLGVPLPSRFFKYYIVEQKGEIIGRAIAEEADGKYHPFGYLLALDKDHQVRSVEILNYHEKYGFEVKQETFTKQFKGLDSGNMQKRAHDIRIISGATISCRSLIKSVQRQLVYLDVMVKGGIKPDSKPSKDVININRNGSNFQPLETIPHFRKRSQLLMGTVLEIQAYGKNRKDIDAAFNMAFQEVNRIEQMFSTYLPDSEISKLNQLANQFPVQVSSEVIELLQRSNNLTEQTMGAFDISVGPLVSLWRSAAGGKPDFMAVQQCLELTGKEQIEIDVDSKKVSFKTNGIHLDLGGIGKGYSMDRAAEVLCTHGIHNALISFGGHILALNPPPGQKGWKIYLRNPKEEHRTLGYVEIKNASAATTADDQRGYWINGKRYSHILNPKTGNPVTGSSSVTIITPKAEQGDALSTALFAMGPDQSVRYGFDHSFQALIIDDEGELHTQPSGFVRDES